MRDVHYAHTCTQRGEEEEEKKEEGEEEGEKRRRRRRRSMADESHQHWPQRGMQIRSWGLTHMKREQECVRQRE